MLVVDQSYFIIMVSLLNKGDDSFNTSVELRHPEGLSLSKFDTIKVQLILMRIINAKTTVPVKQLTVTVTDPRKC